MAQLILQEFIARFKMMGVGLFRPVIQGRYRWRNPSLIIDIEVARIPG
jgi:hypothetical protein